MNEHQFSSDLGYFLTALFKLDARGRAAVLTAAYTLLDSIMYPDAAGADDERDRAFIEAFRQWRAEAARPRAE